VENVAALLGRGAGRVLGDLAECGYDAEWDCLPAAAFGALHIRNRVFLLAYANEHASPPSVCPPEKATVFAGRGGIELSDEWRAEPGIRGSFNGFSSWLDGVVTYADAEKIGSAEVVSTLRKTIEEEAQYNRQAGRFQRISPQEVLLAYVLKLEELANKQVGLSLASTQTEGAGVRGVRINEMPTGTPCRSERKKQRSGEHSDALQALSRLVAQNSREAWSAYRRANAGPLPELGAKSLDGISVSTQGPVPNLVDRLRGLGNAVVPQVAEWIGRRIVSRF
jgi:site-specific DNA-cytosine methylase